MPLFEDRHPNLKLPPEALQQLKEGKDQERADEFGVVQRELYYNPEGHVVCILEGPSAEAIRKHHAALGVDCEEIHEVKRL